MCNYALDLATSVINLEFNKNRVMTRDKKVMRLCHCRKVILENYINTAQMLYIRITARTIKFLEDTTNHDITLNMEDLKHWFYDHAYMKLFHEGAISGKMVLMFRELQSLMDKKFFETFEQRYTDIINIKVAGNLDEDAFSSLLNELYGSMLHWFETAIFNALTLKIDCNNISEKIFSDLNIPPSNFCCYNFSRIDGCDKCLDKMCTKDKCPKHTYNTTHEDIHLYIIDEMLTTTGWIDDYIKLIQRYHNNPKNVEMVFDYKIYNDRFPLKISKDNFDSFLHAEEVFKNVKIINYTGIDFGNFDVSKFLG